MKALKLLIESEIMNKLELMDDLNDIFDINGFHTKIRKASNELK